MCLPGRALVRLHRRSYPVGRRGHLRHVALCLRFHVHTECAEALVTRLVRLRERHRVLILLAVQVGLVLLFERVREYRPNRQDFQLLCRRACHALQQRQKQVVMLAITCVAQIPSF